METPPRTWGRPARFNAAAMIARNTPTDVGKTVRWLRQCKPDKKHPHGRGEDKKGAKHRVFPLETPPRTWGRRSPFIVSEFIHRNTPTDVGKTNDEREQKILLEKHPHGRGEDLWFAPTASWSWETPPRTWGRLRLHVSLSTKCVVHLPCLSCPVTYR